MMDLPRRAARAIGVRAGRLRPSYRRRARFNLQDQDDPSWQRRAERAVDMWARGRPVGDRGGTVSIADFGCGNERLRDVLADRLSDPFNYQGYDLEPQSPTAIKLDLQHELPDRTFDLGFTLGLLEYLEDVEAFLRRLGRVAGFAITTYVISDSPDRLSETERLGRGWRSHYSREGFAELCRTTGWMPLDFELIDDGRTGLWLLRSTLR
jgi:hypothetical protein